MEAEINIKSDNYIQLKENENILKLKIKDENGKETGEMLTFNLEDIELPIKYQNIIEEDKKARMYLENEFKIIDKKQDHKGKKLLSSKEEMRIKALREFYKKEVEIYNMFLGENGVQKLLNGATISWSTFEIINQIINEQILPKLKMNADDINNKIIAKYSNKGQKADIIE